MLVLIVHTGSKAKGYTEHRASSSVVLPMCNYVLPALPMTQHHVWCTKPHARLIYLLHLIPASNGSANGLLQPRMELAEKSHD